MLTNAERYRADLMSLLRRGEEMLIDLSLRDPTLAAEREKLPAAVAGCFERHYQRWYTEAGALVAQVTPGRAAEFEQLYLGDGRRKTVDAATYTIQDWLTGRPACAGGGEKLFDAAAAVLMRLKTQLEILRSAEARFESSLFEIRRLVEADRFDSELDACRELASHGFLRAAGALAGVILERHLRQVLEEHQIAVGRTEPTLNDYNDQLKKAGLLDVPSWRRIQRLADIRNLCGHSKHREPERDEVEELIDGVDRVVRTLA